MKILVCGGRDYADRNKVFRVLDSITPRTDPDEYGNDMPNGVTIIHGGCPTGADRWADEWAVVNWCDVKEFPANWAKHGRAAGPIRNNEMLMSAKPDLVVAFPGGKGTANMVLQAKREGVHVTEIAP